MAMTREEAIAYCTKRWHYLWPVEREISLALYTRVNLAATMRLRPDSELSPSELRVRKRALGED